MLRFVAPAGILSTVFPAGSKEGAMKTSIILLILCLTPVSSSQTSTPKTMLLFKGGPAYYVYTTPDGIGGGPSGSTWKFGPSIGIGLQLPRSESFSLVLMFDYSTYSYDPHPGVVVTGRPRAQAYDVSISAMKVSGNAYAFAGLGLSHAHRDDVNYIFVGSQITPGEISGGNETMPFINLGIGMQFAISDMFKWFVQGNARFRAYSTFGPEAGVSYTLP
jgi:hypothetical protein